MHSMSLESRSTNTNHFLLCVEKNVITHYYLLTYLLIVCEKCFMINDHVND